MTLLFETPSRSIPITKQMVRDAYRKVKSNKGSAGVDEETLIDFDADLSKNLYKLWNRLSSGSYFPQPVKAVEIPLAQQLNAQSRGLTRYFGVHSRWRLRGLFRHLDYRLAKWVKGKYKSITSYQKAYNYLRKIQNSYPNLFYHWSIIGLG